MQLYYTKSTWDIHAYDIGHGQGPVIRGQIEKYTSHLPDINAYQRVWDRNDFTMIMLGLDCVYVHPYVVEVK